MNQPNPTNHDVAIVGMAGRFPKARDIQEFWQNLCKGVEGISFFTDEELAAAGLPANGDDPNFVKARGVLEGADLFDAAFFGVKPKEAEAMDPQHRLFLECAWAALEDAGHDPKRFDGSIGVFAGMSMNTYLAHNLASHPELIAMVGDYQTMLGNDKDFLPTRVSYKLGLTGPSLNIQTACSTSLVAVCVACQHLLNFQCDMALAGAVSVRFPQKQGYRHQTGGIASPDGHCRTFDAKAAGTVEGEGVGIVVLKRLADALADGDHVYAVIKGFATNNDGSNKIGYTAPSVDGQAEVIAQAQAMAGVEPDTISYIEAHGTATPLGDPIEVEALTRAFRERTDKTGYCAIGSVKSSIGHLDTAAGVAGLIKTALALHHKKIPPTLHFERPNPEINFAASPFFVNASLQEWKNGHGPRRAGISSFGIGGTNAHVILEEAPTPTATEKSGTSQLLVLSADSEAALDRATSNLADWLQKNPDADLADVAYTLQIGRRAFPHRQFIVCHDTPDAASALTSQDSKRILRRSITGENRPVAFMFPGQGAQKVNMCRALYETEPHFRATVDVCCELSRPLLGFDLRSVLYPPAGQENFAAEKLTETAVTQPALFVIEYALAKLWMSRGIHPAKMIGHSIGEYVAACLADVFTLEEGLKLVAERGRLMQQQPVGEMLAVRLSEAELQKLLPGLISIAAVNGPASCVASGPTEAIEDFRSQLTAKGVASTVLCTSHAFHSAMMELAIEPFMQQLQAIQLQAPRIPFVSNVSGTWITDREATDPAYWAKHLRQTVRFADGVGELLKDSSCVLLEVGPGETLSNLAKQHPAKSPETVIVASQRGDSAGRDMLLTALGQLWLAGVEIDWAGFFSREKRRRVPLPTYPFERTRYWVEPATAQASRVERESHFANSETEVEPPVAAVRRNGLLLGKQPAPLAESQNGMVDELRALLAEMSGMNLAAMTDSTTFTEMGFESLFLTQASLAIERKFGVRVAFRQLLEDANCLTGLAGCIERQLREKNRLTNLSSLLPAGNGRINSRPTTPSLPGHRTIGYGGDNRGSDSETFPLTAAQAEIWYASQVSDAASCSFNECRLLHLHGPLDVSIVESLVNKLFERHEALRITFAADGEAQHIHASQTCKVPLIDLSDLSQSEADAALESAQAAEASLPFDLLNGPMLRAKLLRLRSDQHVLIVTVHHLICDGHSFGILLREFADMYSAQSRGTEADLPAPMGFSDFAQEQMRRQTDDTQAQEFWLDQFKDPPPILDLPLDEPRPAVWTFEGHCITHQFPAEFTADLKRFSASHDCTLFTTLLAGWSMLLNRLTGQSDFVVGVPHADRSQHGADSVVGHCTNLLPLRLSVGAGHDFAKHLANVQRIFLEAHEHQHFTFGSLLQKLNLPRNTNRMPLVSVTLNVERRAEDLVIPGLTTKITTNPHLFSNFDCSLSVAESNGALVLECRYNRNLFQPETMLRWLRHYQTLLAAAITQPGHTTSQLPLLTDAERQRMQIDWNQTQADYASNLLIHEAFERQVEQSPDKTAVIFKDESLTYRQLNERANRLAHLLREPGVEPDMRIGICVERSVDMLVGLLAILKSGGAYVPLDPSYPPERLAFMLKDSGARVLLTQAALAKQIQFNNPATKTLLIDVQNSKPGNAVNSDVRSENLAYVIYTSGSTGTPKGVALTHRNVMNFFCAMDQLLGREPGVWLAVTSISFDISVLELFWTLARGFTVVLQPDEKREASGQPTRNIVDNILAHNVTHLQCTPSLARAVVHLPGWPKAARQLSTLLLGGEALPPALAQQLLPSVACLLNMYGPTETTVWSTAHRVTKAENNIPIGRPIANTQIHILDSNLQPVPVGVAGELFIGGDGLARGYLNQPQLTAEKFVKHTLGDKPEERLYRTGDLARYRADGTIEFLGRQDGQIKIRGHRIELGEIESTLRANTGLDCIVTANEQSGDTQLAAYLLLPNRTNAPDLTALRQSLERKLPVHMVPATFTFLDAWPLTPNGKLDRRALPSPISENIVAMPSTPAVTPVEKALSVLWRDLLELKQVGTHDNFFELGGHSLLMTQVLARIRQQFGVQLAMRQFFEDPTIAGLANAIEVRLTEEIELLDEAEAERLVQATQ